MNRLRSYEYHEMQEIFDKLSSVLHATDINTINKYIHIIKTAKAMKKLNDLRAYCKLPKIVKSK